MRRVKNAVVVGLIVCMMLVCVGCSKSFSISYSVNTGDQIKVELDTTDGYELSDEEGTMCILDETGATVLTGFFIDENTYTSYLEMVRGTEGVTILEETTSNGVTYTLYNLETSEMTVNEYVCWVDGSSTGILFSGISTMDDAKTAFSKLTFSVE